MASKKAGVQINHEVEALLKQALAQYDWLFDKEGNLNKLNLISLLNRTSPTPEEVSRLETLLQSLLLEPILKAQFFYDIGSIPVFKKEAFLAIVAHKDFLPDSYTAYANHIGLNVWGQQLREIQDVVLDFPYKDCVLEGGQTKDDQPGTEVFYNEVLAPSAIGRLKAPKAFCKVTKYERNQSSPVQSSPVQSSPVQSSPVQSSPVQSVRQL